MKRLEIPLHVCKMMIIEFPQYSSDPCLHSHGDDYQLSIPLSGLPLLEQDGQIHRLEEQTRLIAAPSQYHRHFTNESNGKVLLFNIPRSFINNVIEEKTGSLRVPVEFDSIASNYSDPFIQLARTIIPVRIFDTPDMGLLQEKEQELVQLLLLKQRHNYIEEWRTNHTVTSHPSINRLLTFIHHHYQETLSLDDLEAESKMSKFHLIRTFKELIGMTPMQYVTLVRLQEAKQLILSSKKSITSIAMDTGFRSVSSFERSFKQKYGVSPNEMRRSGR